MMSWRYRLELGDIWRADIPFTEKRDVIAKRIKRLPILSEEDSAEATDLAEQIASTETADEFDAVWDDFYDFADWAHIWVDTIGVRNGVPR